MRKTKKKNNREEALGELIELVDQYGNKKASISNVKKVSSSNEKHIDQLNDDEDNDNDHDKHSIVPIIIFILLFITGLSIMLYPTISNLINTTKHNGIIKEYAYEVENTGNSRMKEMLKAAHRYNASLNNYSIQDVFATDEKKKDEKYEEILRVTKDGLMGYIEIPIINLKLPIYHGTSDDALNKGVGHLQGSSLPVGGNGTHSILAAHRGLPSARLFTDLDKVSIGDKFYIHVLDETLVYEIDNIAVVLPSELSLLEIDNNNDYITLVTCTPYAVNTHRLLVRGKRTVSEVSDDTEIVSKVKAPMSTDTKVLIGCLTGIVIAFIIVIIFLRRKK